MIRKSILNAERMRARRCELSMSQDDLAKRAKVSRVTISELERGGYDNIKVGTLVNLAKALNCTAESLLNA